MQSHVGLSNEERLTLVNERRAEEHVMCAILHASTPLGFLALLPSCAVWLSRRTQSRFAAFQALQAILFQLVSILASGLVFVLFAIGLNYAMFSGLIARTGVNEPELTANLINLAILGFGSFIFFQWVLPLYGVWAAVRLIRGSDFRYPILGRLASSWVSRKIQSLEGMQLNLATEPGPDGNDSALAGLGHLSVLVGLALILAPIFWAIAKQRSRFLVEQLSQACLFQLLTSAFVFIWVGAFWGLGMVSGLMRSQYLLGAELPFISSLNSPTSSTCWVSVVALAFLFIWASSLIAAIQSFRGKRFHYPLIGAWLTHYLAA